MTSLGPALVTSTRREQCYSTSLSLNNIAITLLRQGHPHGALSTFRDALMLMEDAAFAGNESCKSNEDAKDNDHLDPEQLWIEALSRCHKRAHRASRKKKKENKKKGDEGQSFNCSGSAVLVEIDDDDICSLQELSSSREDTSMNQRGRDALLVFRFSAASCSATIRGPLLVAKHSATILYNHGVARAMCIQKEKEIDGKREDQLSELSLKQIEKTKRNPEGSRKRLLRRHTEFALDGWNLALERLESALDQAERVEKQLRKDDVESCRLEEEKKEDLVDQHNRVQQTSKKLMLMSNLLCAQILYGCGQLYSFLDRKKEESHAKSLARDFAECVLEKVSVQIKAEEDQHFPSNKQVHEEQ